MSAFRDFLIREWTPYGQLSEEQLSSLELHYELLVRWNQRMNLTRIRDLSEVVRLHYCESMFLGLNLPKGRLDIVDVGSGAGFPGIPLAIVRPESRVTMVESNHRKAVFLREAARDLPNATVMSSRAEDVSGKFDWLVSRAVVANQVLELGLSKRVALLVTNSDLSQLPSPERVVPVPWGTQRVLALFHVEQSPC